MMILETYPFRVTFGLAALFAIPFFSGCGGGDSTGSAQGIPVSELPTRQSNLSEGALLAAVKERMPAESYFTNAFIPDAGDFESYAKETDRPAMKVRVGMPWIFSDGFSPIYIALEEGFFSAVGLEVEMVPGGPGRDHLQTLVGNQVDIAITADGMNLPVFTASRTGGEILGIGSFLKKNPVAYLSLDPDIPTSEKSKDTVTVEDFSGSTIGVLRGRTHYVEFLVHEYDLDPQEVRVRWTGSTPDALITGVVDHWAAWILDQPRLLEKNGFKNWRPFFFHDLGWKQYCDIVVIRSETARNNPEMPRRFLAAIRKAIDLYFDDPHRAAEITSRYAVDVSFTPEDVLRRFTIERDLVRGDDGLPLLHMDGDRWDRVVARLIKYGIIEEEPFL